ncbi:MAG: hypothetical protein H7338_21180 [Candidatus Sericytochromatia bacterium]|nr:hypothetical protein [Candidatus Sericytochromatia bacterium]
MSIRRAAIFNLLKETSHAREMSQSSHADAATVGRVDLATHQVDWQHAVPLPGQTHLGGDGMAIMPDGKYAIIGKTGAPYGVKGDKGLFSLGL